MMVVAVVMALRLLISWTWRDLMFALCTLLLASPNVYTFPVREPASSDDLLFPKDHLTHTLSTSTAHGELQGM